MKKMPFILMLFSAIVLNKRVSAQTHLSKKQQTELNTMQTVPEMTIEIWSDIACPFCYLGKRTLEQALAAFPKEKEVNIIWRSFQLNPDVVTDTTISTYEYLRDHKGIPVDQAKQMTAGIAERGSEIGITYHFDKAVMSNTRKAHEAIHFAAEVGKQSEMKEALLRAHFTDGQNVDDFGVLVEIATALGLDTEAFIAALTTGKYAIEVDKDQQMAQQIGVRGVPFFVFNRKYAVSGAQPVEVFKETLEKAFLD